MTTYGTIPTSSNPETPQTHLEFVTRAKAQIRSNLQTRRPWSELLSLHSLSLPSSFSEAQLRIRTNLTHFRMNYVIILLLTLFLSLLWHPVSLIVFLLMMAAWLFLYFLRDQPLVVLSRAVDDRLVLLVLGVLTVLFLAFTDVTANIVGALLVGAVVVVAHAAVRRTDDLPVGGDFEDENGGGGRRVVYRANVGGLGERLPLKEAASASYSVAS